MVKWLTLAFTIIAFFIAGIVTNHYWLSRTKPASTSASKNILYWVAPMDPNYQRDKPGKSPMGMDLVPVYAEQEKGDKNIIKISAAVENNLGVKTASVKRIDLSRIIDTVGSVMVDENNIAHIHSFADGWIKTLNVRTTGEHVKKGQLLFELFSPIINNAQEELLLALKTNSQTLIRAGSNKLLTLGVSQSQISQLKKTRKAKDLIQIYAPRDGIVSKLNIREGKFVKPDIEMMTIEDLSQIWVIAEVFERQAGWVKAGQPAIATLPYLPGKTWQGKVDYVYPQLDAMTHALRVRLTFPNPDLTMKPKMYANIKVHSKTVANALAIPRSALIRTGNGDRVIVALGNGQFKAQAVKVGIESGDYYQILSGLKQDDRVVTAAQFLIDSESNLKAGFSRMQMKTGNGNNDEMIMPTPEEFVGTGRIKQVNNNNRTVILDHQPIPALNMPAMIMTLTVSKDVDLKNVNANDEIHFVLIKQANNQYLLTKIHVMPQKKAPEK